MHMVCLDLEGVLFPEIWIAVAETTGIADLKLTTRDVSDYDVLMKHRISVLREHGLRLPDIQRIISSMRPLEGAPEFLEALRERTQVIVLSDTFTEFARPVMRMLGWPTIFCNELVVDEEGFISGYRLRQEDGKRRAVEALRGLNFDVYAAGDSYNDLSMLKAASRGFLFRPPERIAREHPELEVAASYEELLRFLDPYLG
ncbi:phosphoserine phosphatase/homoserine phosphotransferase bifunctional protein [Spirochaeta thermophila DSM 6578]|uniref:phosphoserine phosphatase n=1 Tax=Winmispira thermophila (strain ATCC 700085 / DSM 6578 / Z-1203) TaxID=869211 RepID=G0GG04_WINT7|nr:bifunctional phosphoserine phosphatase/homoserine phosphotransferase ThrH [Spirochaeta thermophila]AEJ62480.1 phosphoserine phosphatase/homoserine phosphotransferase bifunctional protein [Spirochaeta thermophila DSM 6578]